MFSQQDNSVQSFDKPNKIRVVDCIHEGELNWNNENAQWRETLNLYDSKFTTIIACTNFDKAIIAGNEKNVEAYRQDIYKIVDQAYIDFSKKILQGFVDVNINEMDIEGKTVKEYLEQLGVQISDAKENKKNPRELLELVLIKLVILNDLSKIESGSVDFPNSPHEYSPKFNLNWKKGILWSQTDYVKELMDMPFTRDTKEIKEFIGAGISSPGEAHDYPSNDRVLPIYSKTGNMGFNSILYCIFNDYYPVGFGIEPYPVHANYHRQQSFLIARHDYGHSLSRVGLVKKENPEFFNQCKAIYQDLFEERNANKIDEQTFKKELLMLFFIVYESGYHPKNTSHKSVEDIVIERTKPVTDYSETYIGKSLFDRKKTPKPRENIPEHLKWKINSLTVLETIDFVKPFQNIGYPLVEKTESSAKKKPWKAAPYLRECWLDILKGFQDRHPDMDLSAGKQQNSSLTKR